MIGPETPSLVSQKTEKKTQQHEILEKSTNTMIPVSSAEGGIREKMKYRSTQTAAQAFNPDGINDPFVSQCIVRLVDKPQDTVWNEPSCSGSLYVKYSGLQNESQGES